MDPLSDVLSLLKPVNYMSAGFDAGGDWSVQFPDRQKSIKCGAIVSGDCKLSVDGVDEAVHLKKGDGFLLPSGRSFILASDLSVKPAEARVVFSDARNGGIATYNGGGDCFIVSSRFNLGGDHGDILLGMLPPIVHIKTETEQAAIRGLVDQMMLELREQKIGSFLIVQHLAHMMLLQALRLHLSEGIKNGVGWLFALADKQIGSAISAMHEDPGYNWTLQELASQAGMSRSTFALRFKETVGDTPMGYLTRWRMLKGADRLTNSNDSIATITSSLGYESESAFSAAFKRVMGCPPRQYGRRQNAALFSKSN